MARGGWRGASQERGPGGPGMGPLRTALVLLGPLWGEYAGVPPLCPHPLLSIPQAARPPAQIPSKLSSFRSAHRGPCLS